MRFYFFDRMKPQKTSSFLPMLLSWVFGLSGSMVNWSQFPSDPFTRYVCPYVLGDCIGLNVSRKQGNTLFIGKNMGEVTPELGGKFKKYVKIDLVKQQIFFGGALFFVSKQWHHLCRCAEPLVGAYWLKDRTMLHSLTHDIMLQQAFGSPFYMFSCIKEKLDPICNSKDCLIKEKHTLNMLNVSAPYAFIVTAIRKISEEIDHSISNGLTLEVAYRIQSLFFSCRKGPPVDAVAGLLFLVARSSVFLRQFLTSYEFENIANDIQHCIGLYQKYFAWHKTTFSSNDDGITSKIFPTTKLDSMTENFSKNYFQADDLMQATTDIFINLYSFDRYWTSEDCESLKNFTTNQKLAFFYFKLMLEWHRCCLENEEEKLDWIGDFSAIQSWLFNAATMAIALHFKRSLPPREDFPTYASPLRNDNFLRKFLLSCGDNLDLFFNCLRSPKLASQVLVELYAKERKLEINVIDDTIIDYFKCLMPCSVDRFFANREHTLPPAITNSITWSKKNGDPELLVIINDPAMLNELEALYPQRKKQAELEQSDDQESESLTQEETEEFAQKIQDIDDQFEESLSLLEKRRTAMEALEEENDQLRNDNEQNKQSFGELKQKYSVIEKNNQNFLSQLKVLRDNEEKLIEKEKTLEDSLAVAQQENKELKKEVSCLTETNKKLQDDLKAAAEKNNQPSPSINQGSNFPKKLFFIAGSLCLFALFFRIMISMIGTGHFAL